MEDIVDALDEPVVKAKKGKKRLYLHKGVVDLLMENKYKSKKEVAAALKDRFNISDETAAYSVCFVTSILKKYGSYKWDDVNFILTKN